MYGNAERQSKANVFIIYVIVMEKSSQDRIDNYLRGEMTQFEIRQFEREVVNDPSINDDLEITYVLKRSLGKRQQKLYQTSKWRNKKKRTLWFSTLSLVAACLACGLIVFKQPSSPLNTDNGFIAQADSIQYKSEDGLKSTHGIANQNNRAKGNDRLLADAGAVQNENGLSSVINHVLNSDEVSLMSNGKERKAVNITKLSDYEQEWSTIVKNLGIWSDSVVVVRLQAFSKKKGSHKNGADSLLTLFLK